MHSEYFLKKYEIEAKQWDLLLDQLQYAASYSPFYKDLFEKNQLDLKAVKDYSDFQKIPITYKKDLETDNGQFLAVPSREVIDHVTTSGTIGKPVSFFLNEADLQRLAQNEYHSFLMTGMTADDVVQITTTLDRRFMAGMAYFLGLRQLGAGIVRTGAGLPQLQWDSIERFQPTYLIAVPSFLLKMIEFAEQNGIAVNQTSVKAVICIGEPIRYKNGELNALGSRITSAWNIELFSTYASTEMSTAFTECQQHRGVHELSDLIFTEILDDDGNPVAAGQIGELVVTPLRTRTMPLIRYATGDMLTWHDDICTCGRNTKRLGPVVGRKQQRLKFKGTSLFPQHIQESLNSIENLDLYLIEATSDEFGNDIVTILIPEDQKNEADDLKELLQASLYVTPNIQTVERKELEKLKSPKNARKPISFLDRRSAFHKR